ncbi:hypothetical protein QTL97_15150 [Sporosarcina thermotolerans]|uniref:Amino acid transporter n=1 Tax=Sporosarcina thermotolerans TaxID=633404 RepID=A0AAW9AB53_9BACL|nr:hypothetical protein [Sporosarcina thermotolerans]MDW0118269.1 hypothetical protein [Sporosarcina thermotolerans]WHT48583.1 hypothetical protein QNH10_01735 [Sporosarcina thermotolerans]
MNVEICRKVADWMEEYKKPWGIAGGWAIDLFIENQSRKHSDIEIAISREDQHSMRNHLTGWKFDKVVSGELTNWGHETLELPIHELHGKNLNSGDALEVLFNEFEEGKWVFRREPQITYPASSTFLISNAGIPFLNPIIVLLYKAKNTREKDYADFKVVKDSLKVQDKKWLCHALEIHVPGHPWISELRGGME